MSFDDGPGEHTRQLLDVLRVRGVRATFFVLGVLVVRHPDIIRQMARDGHEIGNHSFDHPDLRHLARPEQEREIEEAQRALRALGVEARYFRPPYGAYNSETIDAAARRGLVLALWTIDTKDWKYHTLHAYEAYLDRQLEVRVGGIYLFHDIHASTVQAIPQIIDRLAAQGCRFLTLSQYEVERSQSGPTKGLLR